PTYLPLSIPFPYTTLFRSLVAFLQQRKAGLRVLGDFVACGKRIDRAFLRLAGEEIKRHFLAAFEFLSAFVKVIRLAGFFAGDGEDRKSIRLNSSHDQISYA